MIARIDRIGMTTASGETESCRLIASMAAIIWLRGRWRSGYWLAVTNDVFSFTDEGWKLNV